MKYTHANLAILLMVALGCSSKPSPKLAEDAVRAKLDGGSATRLALVDFAKKDGQASEMGGIKMYTMTFAASAAFADDAYYTTGGSIMQPEVEIRTTAISNRPKSCGEDFSACFAQAPLRASKGDRLRLSGTAQFEKTENGWHVTGIKLELLDRDSLARIASSQETSFAHPVEQSGTPEPSINGGKERPVETVEYTDPTGLKTWMIDFSDDWYVGHFAAGRPDTMTVTVRVSREHPTFWISTGSVPSPGVSPEAFRKDLFRGVVAGAASVDEAQVSLALRNPSGALVAEGAEYDAHTDDSAGKEHTLKASKLEPGMYRLLVRRVRGAGRFSLRYFAGFGGN